MARPLRQQYPGAVYHVTARGNAKQPIILDDIDVLHLLGLLADVVARYGWICAAYCVMPNHYHLLLQTPRPNLSLGMRHLNGVYAQWHNRRHDRVGHLFQGRFHAVHVETDPYALELSRYLVLNPVRSGRSSHPADWAWSSYRATAGLDPSPAFLTTSGLLELFADDPREARARYVSFVAEGAACPEPRGQIYLGSDAFVNARTAGLVPSPEVPRAQWQPIRRPLADVLAATPLDLAIATAYRREGYRLREIAQHLGVHISTVSRRLRAAEMLDCKT